MIKLKCQCCQYEKEFADEKEAFNAGWDSPPYFTGYVCCNACPASFLFLGIDHSEAHKKWKKNGRPKVPKVKK